MPRRPFPTAAVFSVGVLGGAAGGFVVPWGLLVLGQIWPHDAFVFGLSIVTLVVGSIMGYFGAVGAVIAAGIVRLMTTSRAVEAVALLTGSTLVSILCAAWAGYIWFGLVVGVLAGVAYVIVVVRDGRKPIDQEEAAASGRVLPSR